MTRLAAKFVEHPLNVADTDYRERLLVLPGDVDPAFTQAGSLAPVVESLFVEQTASWQDLSASFERLGRLSTCEVALDSTNVVVQLNERRAGRVKEGCFLDAENLPVEQRGIAVAGLFLAINPFPILDRHLTGIHPVHTHQSIDTLLHPALTVSRALGPESAVFYNGPLAGASAPQHAHIQSVLFPKLPVEHSLERIDTSAFDRREGQSIIYLPESLGRTVIAIESPDITAAERSTRAVISELPRHRDDPYDEPRLNLLIRTLADGTVRTLITPRTEREVRIGIDSVLRPATLEAVAGIMVVSSIEDYSHLGTGSEVVRHVYGATTRSSTETRDALAPFNLAA